MRPFRPIRAALVYLLWAALFEVGVYVSEAADQATAKEEVTTALI